MPSLDIQNQNMNSKSLAVKDIMQPNAALSTPNMTLKDCANLMVKNDCGEIPIVESEKNKKLVGVITDRDIICRAVAKGLNPEKTIINDFMTKEDIYTVKENDKIDKCSQLMSEKKVRRLPVVDEKMNCVGIISQAHIARYGSVEEAGELIKNISQSNKSSQKDSTQNLENI